MNITEIITKILAASEFVTATVVVYKCIKALIDTTNKIAETSESELGYLSLQRFKFDIFTQPKYKLLVLPFIAVPLLSIILIVFDDSPLNKFNVLVLSISPCLILFYCTFYYFIHLIDVVLQRGYDINGRMLEAMNGIVVNLKNPKN